MKIIRKEFWVNRYGFESYALSMREYNACNISLSIKESSVSDMKIIIEFEVPEKKIELTESEFLKAIEKFPNSLISTELLRKALFGDK
jgi:hypothetical protein